MLQLALRLHKYEKARRCRLYDIDNHTTYKAPPFVSFQGLPIAFAGDFISTFAFFNTTTQMVIYWLKLSRIIHYGACFLFFSFFFLFDCTRWRMVLRALLSWFFILFSGCYWICYALYLCYPSSSSFLSLFSFFPFSLHGAYTLSTALFPLSLASVSFQLMFSIDISFFDCSSRLSNVTYILSLSTNFLLLHPSPSTPQIVEPR